MSTVHAVEDYTPVAGLPPLMPIDSFMRAMIPINPTEKVAFPDKIEGQQDLHPHAGMYGVIQGIGYDPTSGSIKFDVIIINPATGHGPNQRMEAVLDESGSLVGSKVVGDHILYRVGLGEIQ